MRVSLGAYAVDALDPAERARVDAHLECCEGCRGEFAELREVAALLAAVPAREVEQAGLAAAGEFESADDQQSPQVRRARGRRAGLAVAVVAALVAVVVALIWPGGGHRLPDARSSLTASGTDRATGVVARVTLQRRAWGTAATLSMRGVRPYLRCRLVILALNGTRELVANYRTDPDGTADVTTESAIPITAIASVDVLAGQNQQVVQIPVHSSRSPA